MPGTGNQGRFATVVALAALLVPGGAALAPAGAAAGTLDQYQADTSGDAFFVGSPSFGVVLGQTFRAGFTGGLDQADLYLNKLGPPDQPITVQIRNVASGVPGSTVLASTSLPQS